MHSTSSKTGNTRKNDGLCKFNIRLNYCENELMATILDNLIPANTAQIQLKKALLK